MVGNNPNFEDTDVLRCFLLIKGRVSRKELVDKLELGEGTVRTILDLLKKKDLIDSDQRGHFLTGKGEKLMGKIKANINVKRIEFEEFYSEKKKSAVHVKLNREIKVDYKLRDIAVRKNAEGAIIFIYDEGLKVPGDKRRYKELENEFEFEKNDLLILAFASDYKDAENGALASALYIKPKIKEALT